MGTPSRATLHFMGRSCRKQRTLYIMVILVGSLPSPTLDKYTPDDPQSSNEDSMPLFAWHHSLFYPRTDGGCRRQRPVIPKQTIEVLSCIPIWAKQNSSGNCDFASNLTNGYLSSVDIKAVQQRSLMSRALNLSGCACNLCSSLHNSLTATETNRLAAPKAFFCT